jgi:YVTN family beta-propeller protein
MHPTGKWAYVANAYVDKIAVLDLKEGKLIKWITAGKEPDGLAFAWHGMGDL